MKKTIRGSIVFFYIILFVSLSLGVSLLNISLIKSEVRSDSDNVFIPKAEPDLSYFPPFVSNLLKEEYDTREKEENNEIEDIVKRVVDADDKELEKQADELIKDKGKLQRFLSAVPEDVLKNDQQEIENLIITSDVKKLLDFEYKDFQLLEKNISLNLKNTDVRQAIELIAKFANLNFVIDSGITGNVNNLNLKGVSVASALSVVLSNNNPRLALIKDLEIWRIVKLPTAVQILKSRSDEFKKQDFMSNFKTIYNSKWTDVLKTRIEKMWFGIIGQKKEEDGYYIVFDDEGRKIFFRGRTKNVLDFEKYLEEIDSQIPQVRIETRVVVASKDFEESYGLQISGIYNRSASIKHGWDVVGYGDVKSPNGGGDFKPGNITDWALNLLPSTASKYLNYPFIFGGNNLDTKRLNLVLNAAENKSEIKTILKPTLLVNSNEPAEILVGEEVPIETIVQERVEGTLRDMDTINYKELGIKLRVKPVVTPDKKSVFLDIYVENSYIKDTDSTSFNAKKSIIATTKSKNRVLLASGQTTMIGGLITNEKKTAKRGVPILQDIPVLGFLFKGSKKANKDEQLMIFISPTIV